MSATHENSVSPRTVRIAWFGAAGIVLLNLFYLLVLVPLGIYRVESDSHPLLQLFGVLIMAAMVYSWYQAIMLAARSTLLLERQRKNWMLAFAFLGPAAGTVFVLWYARRTAH